MIANYTTTNYTTINYTSADLIRSRGRARRWGGGKRAGADAKPSIGACRPKPCVSNKPVALPAAPSPRPPARADGSWDEDAQTVSLRTRGEGTVSCIDKFEPQIVTAEIKAVPNQPVTSEFARKLTDSPALQHPIQIQP
jgi:hypothetical protein